MKMLSDDQIMDNSINSAELFPNSLGINSETDFIIYHRRRITPKRN